jgi:hypothetical protein
MKAPGVLGGKGPSAGKSRFSYYLETDDRPLTPRHRLWSRPLPLSRHVSAELPAETGPASISIGDYFDAVRVFMEGPGATAAARLTAGCAKARPDAMEFRIFLAKHGEYYHPGRVQAQAADGKPLELVLNVAVSEAGKALIEKEIAALERLKRIGPPCYVPEVYARAEVPAGNGKSVRMFLGPWFSGYHEFHLTRRGRNGGQGLVIWDPAGGDRFMTADQEKSLYAKAAGILTRYYDPVTACGIGAWHHAAGDFVVRLDGSDPEVRLVSVREYRPLFRRPEGRGAKAVLEALLVFFLNLSLRMRIDRLDGTGELAWAGPVAVQGALGGVLESLKGKPPLPGLPGPIDLLFHHYLLSCGADDLVELCEAVVAAFPPHSPEAVLARPHIAAHAAELAEALRRL